MRTPRTSPPRRTRGSGSRRRRPPGPRAQCSRTWRLAVVGLVVAWALFLAFFGPRAPREGNLPPPDLRAPVPPQRADYGWSLQDIDGAPVELARYRGRAIFLNIWA